MRDTSYKSAVRRHSGARAAVVVPCYNEAHRLSPQAFLEFASTHPGVSFVFVDDGSTDGTLSVLQSLAAQAPGQVEVEHLGQNRGKAEAVRQGVLRALRMGPSYVGYWDADLATPLDAIPAFAELLDERADLLVVMGARVQLLGRDIRRRAVRHYLGRVFATAVSLAVRMPIYDTQCGAKLFRVAPVTAELFTRPFVSRWIFDVEIFARLANAFGEGGHRAAAVRIYEFPLHRWHDVNGSKVRAFDFVRAGWELLRIHRSSRRARPSGPNAAAGAQGEQIVSSRAPGFIAAEG